MLHAPSVTPMVATPNGRVISVSTRRRDCVLTLHLHAHFSRLARFAVVAGIALIGALALVMLVDSARPALAAQSCTTLSSGQIYCLTKTDAFDPIRVGG